MSGTNGRPRYGVEPDPLSGGYHLTVNGHPQSLCTTKQAAQREADRLNALEVKGSHR